MDYFRWAEPADGPSNALVRRLSGGARHHDPVADLRGQRGHRRVPQLARSPSAAASACTRTASRTCRSPTASPRSSTSDRAQRRRRRSPSTGPRVGTIICYERHFPELGRVLALAGRRRHVRARGLRQRADEGGVPARAARPRGVQQHVRRLRQPGRPWRGPSVLRDERDLRTRTARCWPQRGDDEGVVVAEIDADARRAADARVLPFFRDRRPDLYGALASGRRNDDRSPTSTPPPHRAGRCPRSAPRRRRRAGCASASARSASLCARRSPASPCSSSSPALGGLQGVRAALRRPLLQHVVGASGRDRRPGDAACPRHHRRALRAGAARQRPDC